MTQTIITVADNTAILLESTKDWCVDMDNPSYSGYTMIDTKYGRDEVIIGRSKECTEQVRNGIKDISRVNSYIYSRNGIAYIRDLNSFRGTSVISKDGSEMRMVRGGAEDIKLKDGDQITIGEDWPLRLDVKVV